MRRLFILVLLFTLVLPVFGSISEQEFQNPPQWAGVRCWWWWLNSHVTKEAITRDLEEMKARGFSGAMIFDAGGANQWGNNQVPAGPLYGSPEWIELYQHALKEARRLGLVLGLSIQSGWNLGGPNVTPDFAAKQLTWSEIEIDGPKAVNEKLPLPKNRDDYYKDICVLAYRQRHTTSSDFILGASSLQPNYPPSNATDGDPDTFWVSSGTEPGQGPTAEKPQWLEFAFDRPVIVSALQIRGRREYGPKTCRIRIDEKVQPQTTTLQDGRTNTINIGRKSVRELTVMFEDAYDPRYPDRPRNVQVAEITLLDAAGKPIAEKDLRPDIKDLHLKAASQEMGMSAPDCRFLLNGHHSAPGEEDVRTADIVDITDEMAPDGTLTWSAPAGTWTVLRFGYTITDAHVSTSSGAWQGLVIDYLSRDAFDRYWKEVVDPLLEAAGPMKGTVLKQLETDSWECGGMNWSPDFAADFKKYRGYDPILYLPVVAGKIVDSREVSNAFLADLRKTLGDCVADNHYAVFAEYGHKNGLEIQPESGGPHAGPLDAIKNLGKSDIVMAEFWAPSPHRPKPENRFFVKQAASAAHIYGKKVVAAESFTTIGPHWNDVLWEDMKSSMDHELCSGLNMIFFHTFTCSPKEMGLPGQEYFAGTHVNPQVTWWNYSNPFMQYISRCQYIVRQGSFVADVLYYYGDHVPNLARLKEDDPAKVLPGYDYDVTDELTLQQLKVADGKVVTPSGMTYRILVLPDHKILSLAALEKVKELLEQGATVIGPRPERMVSLVGGDMARRRFSQLTDQLWGEISGVNGERIIVIDKIRGRLIWGKTARQVLTKDGVKPDFEYQAQNADALLDYIHYTIDGADVYFVSNQTPEMQDAVCQFRINGRQPQLWDPVTGSVRQAAFTQEIGRTSIPLRFTPYGSVFVVFADRTEKMSSENGVVNYKDYQPIQTINGPWQVSFDPKWGGPASVQFAELTDWAAHSNQAVKYYSGKAAYNNTFDFPQKVETGKEYWLDLGRVEDVGIAKVTLNGQDLGIVWTKPFRVDISNALKQGGNTLEVDVVNSWRNRLIGDRNKPADQRLTNTNIAVRRDWPLETSGLLGPVQILREQ